MPAAPSRPAPGRQTAVDKALFLLTSLAEQDGDVGVSELARRARLTKSTAFRRLGTRLHDMGNRVDGPPRSSSRNSSCPTSPTCLRQQDPRPPHDSLALPDRRPPARLPHRRRPHPPRGHRLRPPGGLPRPHLRRRPRHGPRRTAGRRPLRRRRRPPLRPRPPRPRPAPRRLRRLPHPHRLTTPPRAATRSPCHPVAQRRDPRRGTVSSGGTPTGSSPAPPPPPRAVSKPPPHRPRPPAASSPHAPSASAGSLTGAHP